MIAFLERNAQAFASAGMPQSASALVRTAPAAAREATDRLSGELSNIDRQIGAVLNNAARLQNAMDGFAGPPTAAQLRDLDVVWEEATSAVASLNRLISRDLPAAYTAAGAAPPALKPVPAPSRKR